MPGSQIKCSRRAGENVREQAMKMDQRWLAALLLCPRIAAVAQGPDKDLEQLLHQADDNMYQIKKEMKEQKNDLL